NIQNHHPKIQPIRGQKPTNTSKITIPKRKKKNKFDALCYLKNKTNDENKNKKQTIQINKNINFNKLYCMFFHQSVVSNHFFR
ncbi:TPA: hypothetical protein ACF2T8_004924, partial [Escherichia coli]